jgi:hypothetical protein
MTRLSIALVALLVGCSGSSEEEKTPDPTQRFENESVIVAPADSTNPACAGDPRSMDRTTFASCVRMDVTRLPADYEVTYDVASFHPEKRNASILIMGALEGVPAPWFAIVGITPSALPGGKTLLEPKNGGAAVALVGGGVAVIEGAGFVVAAPEILAAAAATGIVMGTVYLINHRQDIADGAQKVIEAVQTKLATPAKRPCTEGIPTGYTPEKERQEYWQRCPQGVSTK